MKPEYAQAILAMLTSDPQGFATACQEVAPDDPEQLAMDITDWLSVEAGTEDVPAEGA